MSIPCKRALKSDTSNYRLEFNLKDDSSLGGKAWSKIR